MDIELDAKIREARQPSGLTNAQHKRLLSKLARARQDRDKARETLKALTETLRSEYAAWQYRGEQARHENTLRQLRSAEAKHERLLARVAEKALDL